MDLKTTRGLKLAWHEAETPVSSCWFSESLKFVSIKVRLSSMINLFLSFALVGGIGIGLAQVDTHLHDGQTPLHPAAATEVHQHDWLPSEVRAFWMRRANQALHELVSPCPVQAFGTVIVNHTRADELGEVVCIGANGNIQTGNPTMHGEIAAINNCTAVLSDPHGRWRLSPLETSLAFHHLTLYTNAEPCPMCASAIRWAGFRECVFGTSIETLTAYGWRQIQEASEEVFARSWPLGPQTVLHQHVLPNETDPFFAWQHNLTADCPRGCNRQSRQGRCLPM